MKETKTMLMLRLGILKDELEGLQLAKTSLEYEQKRILKERHENRLHVQGCRAEIREVRAALRRMERSEQA